ncbi:MAG TPA: AI-2E family transporter [Tepidisphaeraceae bacterium]|nr:AI-2E family transporter [Tepidisphaeraceae bacterium]
MTKTRLRVWIALGAVTLIAVYLCWQIAAPFIDVIMWAAMLSIVTYPVYHKFRTRNYSSSVASLATVGLACMVVFFPLAIMSIVVATEAAQLSGQIKPAIDQVLDPESTVSQFMKNRLKINIQEYASAEKVTEAVQGASAAVLSRTTGFIGGIVGFIIQLFFVLFAMFYFLRDSSSVVPAIRKLLPLSENDTDAIFQRTTDVIYASLVGVVVIAAVQGFLGGVAFALLGIPSPILWGMVMFLLSMIPVAGAGLVWVPASIYLAVNGEWVKAIILVLFGTLVIGMIDNFLRPIVVGKRAKLSELVIFFAVLGGLAVYGILGLVIGPVIVAVTLTLIDLMRRIGDMDSEAAKVIVEVGYHTDPLPLTDSPERPAQRTTISIETNGSVTSEQPASEVSIHDDKKPKDDLPDLLPKAPPNEKELGAILEDKSDSPPGSR